MPFDTRRLRNGNHRMVAIVQLVGGGRVDYSADFRVGQLRTRRRGDDTQLAELRERRDTPTSSPFNRPMTHRRERDFVARSVSGRQHAAPSRTSRDPPHPTRQ